MDCKHVQVFWETHPRGSWDVSTLCLSVGLAVSLSCFSCTLWTIFKATLPAKFKGHSSKHTRHMNNLIRKLEARFVAVSALIVPMTNCPSGGFCDPG